MHFPAKQAMSDRQGRGRVIVLGADGLDATLFRRWLESGDLPHLAALAAQGGWSPLRTTDPAESPVAWATFATGQNPGKHSIFDFIRRDPETYALRAGPLAIRFLPDSKGLMAINYRRGKAFWDLVSQAGKTSVLLRVPGTCPPEPIQGRVLAGFGVPDLLGTWGSSRLYTSAPQPKRHSQAIALPDGASPFETAIPGPQGASLPLRLAVEGDALRLDCQGETLRLRAGKWSRWMSLRFRVPAGETWQAIARFYLRQIRPHLLLYLSPLNLDPCAPAMPLSFPDSYAAELAARHGLFSTLGWPEDVTGLDEGRLDELGFLYQVYETLEQQEAMTLAELEGGDFDLLVSVFEATDRVQHMFWPDSEILRCYRRFDEVVGHVARRLAAGDTLLIVSDHGFQPVHKLVHLNTWLQERGYLAAHGSYPSGVDWSRTRAYALGLSEIYINLRGRERQGIVEPGRVYEKLCQEIAAALLDLRDPETGKDVVCHVYHRDQIYHGPHAVEAGDLVIGLHAGYRTSQQTAVGNSGPAVIVPNARRWRADHCSLDPPLVPGVLCSNRPLALRDPSLLDLAPTILDLLGVPSPADMDGRSLRT